MNIYSKFKNKNYIFANMMKQDNLEIIKEGKTGHGILIENDGYMFIKNPQAINEEFRNGEWNVPYPFIVDAVFQKFGIKNANGRIYPEAVLKKQVELYQQKINERRALGEENHPQESTIDLGRIAINIIEWLPILANLLLLLKGMRLSSTLSVGGVLPSGGTPPHGGSR